MVAADTPALMQRVRDSQFFNGEEIYMTGKKSEGEHGRVLIIETSSQKMHNVMRRFYLNLHYCKCARIADFYKPGDDRIIFKKYLEQIGSLKSNG